MDFARRLSSLAALGKLLRDFSKETRRAPELILPARSVLESAITRANVENQWFTREFILYALREWGENLQPESMECWLEPFRKMLEADSPPVNVGIVMPGNIPLAGFHDLLSVLVSGHHACIKLSPKDTVLIPALMNCLCLLEPRWKERVAFPAGSLQGIDAVIATGSNNSARYFAYYFNNCPHIIRGNRNSIAILTGEEDEEELSGIAQDIFLYFGLGCRSVSKLYIPAGFDIACLQTPFSSFRHVIQHQGYANNLTYYRSVFTVSRIPYIDGRFYLLSENAGFASPVSVIYTESYPSLPELTERLDTQRNQLQCIVCSESLSFHTVLPGMAQRPALWDYADGINTIRFLTEKF